MKGSDAGNLFIYLLQMGWALFKYTFKKLAYNTYWLTILYTKVTTFKMRMSNIGNR